MDTSAQIDRFAAIKQAQQDRAAAADAQRQAAIDADLEVQQALVSGLDRFLRLLGILTEADASMTTNTFLDGALTFSLIKSKNSPYTYLNIEHLLNDEESTAATNLMWRDNGRLNRLINADNLLDHEPKPGQIDQLKAHVGDDLTILSADYTRLRDVMAEAAAKAARPPVVVLEYNAHDPETRTMFVNSAADLVKAGYKPNGYTSTYGLVSAMFILSED